MLVKIIYNHEGLLKSFISAKGESDPCLIYKEKELTRPLKGTQGIFLFDSFRHARKYIISKYHQALKWSKANQKPLKEHHALLFDQSNILLYFCKPSTITIPPRFLLNPSYLPFYHLFLRKDKDSWEKTINNIHTYNEKVQIINPHIPKGTIIAPDGITLIECLSNAEDVIQLHK